MSQVNILGCPICNPEVADFRGIRRTVVPTSTELLNFVRHVISAHTGLAGTQALAATANDTANTVMEKLNQHLESKPEIVKIPIPKGDNNLEVKALREQANDAPAKIDAPKSE